MRFIMFFVILNLVFGTTMAPTKSPTNSPTLYPTNSPTPCLIDSANLSIEEKKCIFLCSNYTLSK